MRGGVAHKRLILRAAGALVADEVGICAAKAGRMHSLVGIHHDFVLGGFGEGVEVVIAHPLAVVVLAAREYIAHVAALDRVVAILVHQAIGGLHVALVVAHRRRRLMMHHQAHPL